MTPEFLWKLSRVSGVGLTKDKTALVYTVSTPDAAENKSSRKTYMLNLSNNGLKEISSGDSLVANTRLSPDGKYTIASKEIKLEKIYGKDFYPDLQNQPYRFTPAWVIAIWTNRKTGLTVTCLFNPL